MSDDTLGSRIARVRGEMTQREFAKKLGIGRATLIRYENGENDPPASILQKLINDFGADPQWLLVGGDPPEQEMSRRERAMLNNYRQVEEGDKRIIETTAARLLVATALTKMPKDGKTSHEVWREGQKNAHGPGKG